MSRHTTIDDLNESLAGHHWQQRLSHLAAEHQVPGACLGILRIDAGGIEEAAYAHHGVLSTTTRVEVDDDTLFQIGSITKVWTATVIMQLVDEGRLDLDQPVIELLPELRLADAEVAQQVTMRHLLSHTSGIDGDVFTDTGRGDDCLERYVEALAEVDQIHPLGATLAYCNAGFNLAGRVIERLTRMTWDQAIRERLFAPLGLEHTVTLPEEALLFRAAVGHLNDDEGTPQPTPRWSLPRSVGPAGLVTATARDVLSFARMHLSGGVAADGTRVLSEDGVTAMTEHQADAPDRYTLGDSWGLGWVRFGWDGRRIVGHDGGTIGQTSFLRVLSELGLAVVLLTNGGRARDLYEDLFREIFADVAGVALPEPIRPADPRPSLDSTPFVGTYERTGARIEVFEDRGRLHLRDTDTDPMTDAAAVPRVYELHPVRGEVFVVRAPGARTWTPVVFYSLPDGERYVHFGMRATPRVSR